VSELTRFRLFAQAPLTEAFSEPETVTVSVPAGGVGPGPCDERMYVVDPIGKPEAYGHTEAGMSGPGAFLPPWTGPAYPPALPDAAGHFDHIPVDAPEFEAAHLYAAVRLTLDIWEGYFGHRLEWHFRSRSQQLELVLQRDLFENAFMGFGFLEVGVHKARNGDIHPFSLNFDVIAHETGHCIIFSAVGVPAPDKASSEYLGFHESAADLTALIAAMHFKSVLDELLKNTRGNLYTLNHVNRIIELTGNGQIRRAANDKTLYDFEDGWQDEHTLAQPLTAAIFDILVDVFHEQLLDAKLIDHAAEDLSDHLENDPDYHAVMQPIFDRAYARAPDVFRQALVQARDIVGFLLAETWRALGADDLNYADVGRELLIADEVLTNARYKRIIYQNLVRRGIGHAIVGPKRERPKTDKPGKEHNHMNSTRTFVPDAPAPARGLRVRRPLSYRERLIRAGGRS